MCFGGLPHGLIMSPSVQFGFSLGMWLYGRRFGYLQRVVFTKNFWNFKVIPKNHFDVYSKQTCSEKFKRLSWICLHECWKIFVLLLVKWSDVWLVKRVQTLIWGFQRNSVQSIHFACMNNALFHMGKQSLPIQIACLWSERAWLGM